MQEKAANNPHCKIGKVTPKGKLRLLEPLPRNLTQEDVMAVQSWIPEMMGGFKLGCAGVVVVTFGFDGAFSRAWKLHKDAPWGKTMIPSFVAEILRRDVASDCADERIDERFF